MVMVVSILSGTRFCRLPSGQVTRTASTVSFVPSPKVTGSSISAVMRMAGRM